MPLPSSYFPDITESKKQDFVDIGNNKTLLKYFQNIQKHFIYANNFGLALDDEDNLGGSGKPILLEKLFVAPNLSKKHLSPSQVMNLEIEKTDFQNVTTTLKENKRLFVLGDPGTGKSTLVNWLMLALTSTSDNKIKLSIGNLVPFIFILREMDFENINTWDDLCEQQVDVENSLGEPFAKDKETLLRVLKSGQALFLLDGLDEITQSEQRKKLSQIVLDGMSKYSSCHFIITSRIIGFDQYDWLNIDVNAIENELLTSAIYDNSSGTDIDVLLKEHKLKPSDIEGKLIARSAQDAKKIKKLLKNSISPSTIKSFFIKEVYLSPFVLSHVTQFVNNWFKQYVTEGQDRNRLARILIERLKKNDGLSQLSRIPVLLNMICFIHSRRGRLPDGRAELYQRIAETYLTGLDKARNIKFQGNTINFDYIDLSEWLGELALKMQKSRNEEDQAIMISENKVKKFLLKKLEENDFEKERAIDEVKNTLAYLGQRSGIFIPRGENKKNEEQYAFTHLSFLEYFAAKGMKAGAQFWRKKEWKKYQGYIGKPWWRETFILFFEQLEQDRQTKLYMDSLFSKFKSGKKEPLNEAMLLADIIMDTSIRFISKERKEWIVKLWKWYFRENHSLMQFNDIDDELPYIFNKLWVDLYNSKELFVKLANDLSVLSLNGTQVIDISALSGLDNLSELSLANTQVCDISALSGLENLFKLDLDDTQVSDISVLSGLDNLSVLFLDNTQVSDISALSGLVNLFTLFLNNTQVSDISALSGLDNLSVLFLFNTQVTDLSVLSGLDNLSELYLANTQVSDISALSGLDNLSKLHLSNTQVSDISALSGLDNLSELHLSNTQVSDISVLSGLDNLSELHLSNTQVSDLSALSGLESLSILDLDDIQVSDISALSGLDNLSELYLANTQVSDISALSGLDNLSKLHLSNTQVSDISALSGLENLSRLYLNNTQVSDLSALLYLNNLMMISLDGSKEFKNIDKLKENKLLRIFKRGELLTL